MPFDDLLAEAQRQLSICNSCRYCEGYCPVWPALELRTELSRPDVAYLASLCHDCQSCLTACMYSPPHEFGVDPPALFALVRADTYRRYVWPPRPVAALRGWRGLLIAFAAACLLLTALALLIRPGNGDVFAGQSDRSPYALIPHLALVIVVLLPSAWTLAIMIRAAWLYWRDIDGGVPGLLDARAWTRTLWQAATLAHQSGGDDGGCTYPDETPSGVRRRWHHLVAYGFLLTFVSTVAAWILQTFRHENPPYSLISVPVLAGSIGGIAASLGCAGLLVLKRRSEAAAVRASAPNHVCDPHNGRESTPAGDVAGAAGGPADYALLWAILALMLTGLAVLASRTTALFAPVLVIHLAAVITAFAIAPYTRFFHWLYRILSIQRSNLEQSAR